MNNTGKTKYSKRMASSYSRTSPPEILFTRKCLMDQTSGARTLKSEPNGVERIEIEEDESSATRTAN